MDTILFYNVGDPYGFLSNFYRAPIELDGHTWPTTEHYFQAMKFPDPQQQAAIRAVAAPGPAKQLAWSEGMVCRSDWDEVRDEVMLQALRAKFTQHPDLQAQLLATGDAMLVEHTRNDSYWADGGDGSGLNRLGVLLMAVRAELRGAE